MSVQGEGLYHKPVAVPAFLSYRGLLRGWRGGRFGQRGRHSAPGKDEEKADKG
ncbi:MAG: hypothetical protein ICV60_11255 [Pyrinomonadaceae bacterium]|nr:hypothetical protein [Pyrinomonadaceae bacterium]